MTRTTQGREAAHRALGSARAILDTAGSLGGSAARWTVRTALTRPASSAAGAAFAALMFGVTLNALVLQKARHPAPLFDAPVAQETAPAPVAAAAAQLPPAAENVDRAPTGTLPAGPDAATGAAPMADAPQAGAAPQQPDDRSSQPAADAGDQPKPKAKKRDHGSRHGKAASKKAKGHDKISQLLNGSSENEPRRHRHKKKDD